MNDHVWYIHTEWEFNMQKLLALTITPGKYLLGCHEGTKCTVGSHHGVAHSFLVQCFGNVQLTKEQQCCL